MNEKETLAVALENLSRELHTAKRPIDGILADKKLTAVPVRHIKALLDTVEGTEKNLNALSVKYYQAPASEKSWRMKELAKRRELYANILRDGCPLYNATEEKRRRYRLLIQQEYDLITLAIDGVKLQQQEQEAAFNKKVEIFKKYAAAAEGKA